MNHHLCGMIPRRSAPVPHSFFRRHWLPTYFCSLHSSTRSSLRSLLLNMPSYKTLAVLVLAASTASPALSAPVQEIREQAPSRREPVKRFKMPSWKSMGGKVGDFALMAAVTTAATEAGSAIFHAISKPAAGDAVKAGGNAATDAAKAGGDPIPATEMAVSKNSVYPNTPQTPGGSGSTTSLSTNGEPPTTPPTTYYQGDSISAPSTNGERPSNPATFGQSADPDTVSRRSVAKRDLVHSNLFARSVWGSNSLNRRTPSHLDLSSRADLEEALSLISRMFRVDELD